MLSSHLFWIKWCQPATLRVMAFGLLIIIRRLAEEEVLTFDATLDCVCVFLVIFEQRTFAFYFMLISDYHVRFMQTKTEVSGVCKFDAAHAQISSGQFDGLDAWAFSVHWHDEFRCAGWRQNIYRNVSLRADPIIHMHNITSENILGRSLEWNLE